MSDDQQTAAQVIADAIRESASILNEHQVNTVALTVRHALALHGYELSPQVVPHD